MTQQHIDFMLSKIPMGRFLEVGEAAAMVAWLSSRRVLVHDRLGVRSVGRPGDVLIGGCSRASEAAVARASALRLRRSTLRADCPAVLASAGGEELPSVRLTPASVLKQLRSPALRAGNPQSPALLGARRVAPTPCRPRLRRIGVAFASSVEPLGGARAKARSVGVRSDSARAEERSAARGAAAQRRTGELSEVAARSAPDGGIAAALRSEHRRAVGPQARPPQSERSTPTDRAFALHE